MMNRTLLRPVQTYKKPDTTQVIALRFYDCASSEIRYGEKTLSNDASMGCYIGERCEQCRSFGSSYDQSNSVFGSFEEKLERFIEANRESVSNVVFIA